MFQPCSLHIAAVQGSTRRKPRYPQTGRFICRTSPFILHAPLRGIIPPRAPQQTPSSSSRLAQCCDHHRRDARLQCLSHCHISTKRITTPVSAARNTISLISQLPSSLPIAPSSLCQKVAVPGRAPHVGLSPRKVATTVYRTAETQGRSVATCGCAPPMVRISHRGFQRRFPGRARTARAGQDQLVCVPT